MERGIALIDFVNTDSMIQVHGNPTPLLSPCFLAVSLTESTDHEGVGLRSQTANTKAAAAQATKIFQDYYPEFLVRVLNFSCVSMMTLWKFKKFYINVPTFMTWIFWLFKPLISANTLAKLNVVGSGTATIGAALLPVIDAKELPKRYGGEAEAF